LVTTHCNANCPYCYEEGYKPHFMSRETADSVVSFILSKSVGVKTISIAWYGGEPLLNSDIITYICSNILDKRPDLCVNSVLLTNGSLINEDLVNSAVSCWNLKRVQITLDGLDERYSAMKRYSNEKYNFKLIINNIKILLKHNIRVKIRINYDNTSIIDAIDLIDYLYSEFGNSISVYCSELISTSSYHTIQQDEQDVKNGNCILFSRLLKYGYISAKKILARKRVNCGFAAHEDFVLIDSYGNLHKCPHALAHPEISRIGDVWTGVSELDTVKKWCTLTPPDSCKQCRYFPLCLGGCKCNSFGLPSSECFRYKKIIPEIILHEYYARKKLGLYSI